MMSTEQEYNEETNNIIGSPNFSMNTNTTTNHEDRREIILAFIHYSLLQEPFMHDRNEEIREITYLGSLPPFTKIKKYIARDTNAKKAFHRSLAPMSTHERW